MNATMTAEVTDQATALSALNKVRDDLANALSAADTAMDTLRIEIRSIRPKGVLTVDEMAEAIGHDRNYVDSVWSSSGETAEGRQTRVKRTGSATEATKAIETLASASRAQRVTAAAVPVARAERNRVVAMVYASRILGPSAIAAAVDVDRNHVLRIARKAGVTPQHRTGSRNQHSK